MNMDVTFEETNHDMEADFGEVQVVGAPGGDVEIPETLPNPHKLTFTGAVNAEYDGSEAVEVNIPAGGDGGEMRHIRTIELEEDMQWVYFDTDSDGKPFDVKDLAINVYSVGAEGNTSEGYLKILPNTTTYILGKQITDIGSVFRKNGSSQSISIAINCNGVNGYSHWSAVDNRNVFDADMKFYGRLNSTTVSHSVGFGCASMTSLLFGSDSASVLMGKGTKIAIWGR